MLETKDIVKKESGKSETFGENILDATARDAEDAAAANPQSGSAQEVDEATTGAKECD